MKKVLLQVRDLCVEYWNAGQDVPVVDQVSFDIREGEIFGLAGESGSGKSTIGKSIMRILPPPGVISGGQVLFKGQDILQMSDNDLRALRWSQIAMVFQSALESLNPVLSIGEQIIDTLEAHGFNGDRTQHAQELMELVGIDPARISSYPHQLSGGMRQRVGIALALALTPDLLIMDEPTTALDVVVQREILQRIYQLRSKFEFSILFITHDLPLMLSFADRIGILYAGRVCEIAPAKTLLKSARHPYAQSLMSAFPDIEGKRTPQGISGNPPSLRNPPSGCRFHPRCEDQFEACSLSHPKLVQLREDHEVACHLTENDS